VFIFLSVQLLHVVQLLQKLVPGFNNLNCRVGINIQLFVHPLTKCLRNALRTLLSCLSVSTPLRLNFCSSDSKSNSLHQDTTPHSTPHPLCSVSSLMNTSSSQTKFHLFLKCYYHIRELRCICPHIDSTTACIIASSIVQSKLDYGRPM